MINHKSLIYFLLVITLGLNSCILSYKPQVNLPVQEYTFSKKFKFEDFYDLRPATDTIFERGLFKFKTMAPNKYNYKGSLAKDLKSSISDGFKSTKFVGISEDDYFDFKIVGEVSHFYLKRATTHFGFFSSITYFGAFLHFFGIPTIKELAKVELKFNVFTNKNILLGSYNGKYDKKRKFGFYGSLEDNYENIFNNYLSLAVMDIQSQMIADSLKYR
jgi:hypothetical protein